MEKALSPALIAVLAALLIVPLSSAFSFTGYISYVGDAIELDIAEPGISLDKVNFALQDGHGDFVIRVERIDPETVKPGAYWIYEYFFVNVTGMEYAPEYVVMDFSVGKSWIDDENVDTGTIALSFYDEEAVAWERLSTVELSEDADYVHFRAESPSLAGLFTVTGEPVPVEISIVAECDGNGICDSSLGENEENCGDCLSEESFTLCTPAESRCIGDSLVTCTEDGKGYTVEECGACREGECLTVADDFTGLFIEGSPLYIVIVVALVSLIAYLAVSLNNIRRLINNAEKVKDY